MHAHTHKHTRTKKDKEGRSNKTIRARNIGEREESSLGPYLLCGTARRRPCVRKLLPKCRHTGLQCGHLGLRGCHLLA